jgi:outer membrane protein assembly factor BamB
MKKTAINLFVLAAALLGNAAPTLPQPASTVTDAQRVADPPNWPQFRGPGGTSVAADDANPPIEFGPEQSVLWRVASGVGHGSPCIWGNQLFLLAFDAKNKRGETVAFDRRNGTELWRRALSFEALEKRGSASSNRATATPATDGERVYVYFGSYGLAAYTLDGQTAWERPLPAADIAFGSGTSPVVHDGLVLLSYGGQPEANLHAFAAQDGSPRWKAPLKQPGRLDGSHATPVVWNGQVVVHDIGRAAAFNLRDGSPRWSVAAATNATATPVVHEGMLYLPGWNNSGDASFMSPLPAWAELVAKYDKNGDGKISKDECGPDLVISRRPEMADNETGAKFTVSQAFAYFDTDKDGGISDAEWEKGRNEAKTWVEPHGLMAIRPGGSGDVTATHVAWIESKDVPEVPSPLVYRGRVYMVTNGGKVTCMDAKDGQVYFRGRLEAPGEYYASPVAAAGRIYFASRNGVVTVIEHGDALKVLARNDLKARIAASPAIVGDVLYVRTAAHLYAFRAPARL